MSISKAQAEFLASGILNRLGEQRIKEDEFPVVESLLNQFGGQFVITAQNNLIANKNIASGDIKDIRTNITKYGNTYTLSLGYSKNQPASKYWKFVNKGVRGTKNEKADSKTPYKFNPSKKSIPIAVAQRMIDSGKKKTTSVKPYRKLGVETKAIEDKKSLAYLIASSIHRRGLSSTHYFDNAAKETFGQNFYDVMTAALGKDIQIKIRQIGKELNNGNNNTK
jgi:hypothetical protein